MKIMDTVHFLEFLFTSAFRKLGFISVFRWKSLLYWWARLKKLLSPPKTKNNEKSLIEGTVGFWVMIPWVVPDVSKEAITLIFTTEDGGT
jgi:hypothetical protein